MVHSQLRRRGIRDERVLRAMESVPRHLFIPEGLRADAYDDNPVAIGEGQTISQPFIVGFMLQLLNVNPEHRVLEVGTGTGYQAALLAELAREVYTIERVPELYEIAHRVLKDLGYTKVEVICGDGSQGLPSQAPFDRIIVAAAAPQVPRTLFNQLSNDGRMIVPVGSSELQQLLLVHKQDGKQLIQESEGCRFVPLVGEQGFPRG